MNFYAFENKSSSLLSTGTMIGFGFSKNFFITLIVSSTLFSAVDFLDDEEGRSWNNFLAVVGGVSATLGKGVSVDVSPTSCNWNYKYVT